MTDHQAIQDDEPIYEDAAPTEVWEDDDPHELPRRPRRRVWTPSTVGLLAVLVAALGFIGGVQVQKGQDDGGAAGPAAAGGAPAGFPGAAAGRSAGDGQPSAGGSSAGGSSAAPTMGTVASKDGSTLYVTDSSGATVKVRTKDSSTVTRTAKSTVAGVHPGDTVIVTGAANANGTVTASSIVATAKGASAFGGAGGAGLPGGGMPGGAPGGGAPTGG